MSTQTKQVLQGALKPAKGHRCYQLHRETGEISEAPITTKEATVKGKIVMRRSLIQDTMYIYTTALNKKSAAKHFSRLMLDAIENDKPRDVRRACKHEFSRESDRCVICNAVRFTHHKKQPWYKRLKTAIRNLISQLAKLFI